MGAGYWYLGKENKVCEAPGPGRVAQEASFKSPDSLVAVPKIKLLCRVSPSIYQP